MHELMTVRTYLKKYLTRLHPRNGSWRRNTVGLSRVHHLSVSRPSNVYVNLICIHINTISIGLHIQLIL